MTAVRKLSWEAMRSGPIYCAPACGGGCTWAAFNKATQDAAKLAAECGPGWRGRVHENLGWRYSAVSPCENMRVHVYKGKIDSYTAYLHPDKTGSGRWTGEGTTPREAIMGAAAKAMADRDKLLQMVDEMFDLETIT